MARTRTIKPEFWTDEKLGSISRDARYLFMGLLSHCDDGGMCRGNSTLLKSQVFLWDSVTPAQVEKHIKELESINAVFYLSHNHEKYVFIRNFHKHQKINRPSTFRFLIELCDEAGFYALLSEKTEEINIEKKENDGVLIADSLNAHELLSAQTETETETKTETKTETETETKKGGASSRTLPEILFKIYNEENNKLPVVRQLTDTRRKHIRKRYAERESDIDCYIADFCEAIKRCHTTPFLFGQNERGWRASFDWLISNDSNYLKVLEGSYETQIENKEENKSEAKKALESFLNG